MVSERPLLVRLFEDTANGSLASPSHLPRISLASRIANGSLASLMASDDPG